MSRPLALALVVAITVAAAAGGPARASQRLSDTDVTGVSLEVNRKGEALITYTRRSGQVRHVLAWGAVNALPPTVGTDQVRFSFDYAGGWGRYRNASYWKAFRNACRPYDGPTLPDFVVGCKAPDGSYWALQSWQRELPLLGFQPWEPHQSAFELHVSHWTGALPVLTVGVHWTYGHSAVGLFGQLAYLGQPVHGFGATPSGNPTDRYSRNVYIDTFDSVYGAGWKREAGILVHTPGGTFCHSFVPQTPPPGYPSTEKRPAAPGTMFRVTVMGPGVTPVIQWVGHGLDAWSGSEEQRSAQAEAGLLWNELMTGDAQCAGEAG